ncbi:MAG TPA: restriction endonuclease subunit S [Roseiarcus sp.]|jgi:type I restriction enzyme S subunit
MSLCQAGWVICKISDVLEVNPGLDRSPFPQDAAVHFVPMSAVETETGKVDVSQLRPFSEVRKGYTPFVAGDIIFAKITPCMENGKIAVVPELMNSVACGSTEFHVLRAKHGVVPSYIYYFVSAKKFRFEAKHQMTGAVGQKRVPTGFLEGHPLPLPPTNEQRRIVAKIEELFSELDASAESLTRARAQLKTYRQALLKAAFEGKLTTDWRAANPDKLHSLQALLARIRGERDARFIQATTDWETALADWEHQKQVGDRPSRPRRNPAPDPPTAHQRDNMTKLPSAWQWLQIADFAFVTKLAGFEYTKYVKYDETGDLPVIKAENAGHLGFRETSYSFVRSETVASLKRSILRGGELLMVFVGAGTGNVGIVPNGRKYFLGPNIAMLRIETQCIATRFVELFLRSPLGSELKLSTVKAVAQPSLSMETIRQIPIPVPSTAEQSAIVAIVGERLSAVDRAEAEIADALSRIKALRQSILNRAFSGQLVPQDPSDEPAAALLARLRAQSSYAAPGRKTRRKQTA